MRHLRIALVVASGACSSPAPESASLPASLPAPTESARDSLVLDAGGGITVWFAGARVARDPHGERCSEWVLEVRQDSVRRIVPLLYTREAPVRLTDTSMRAVLYAACAAVAPYAVDYATLSPRKLAP